METKKVYVTINHLDNYDGSKNFRVGDKLSLRKDHNNPYDDEAIMACNKHDIKCGYVANSVYSVARGTQSAGRIYEKMDETDDCTVRFITDEMLIAEMDKLK